MPKEKLIQLVEVLASVGLEVESLNALHGECFVDIEIKVRYVYPKAKDKS